MTRPSTASDVDWALGHAAVHGRFATGDLESILATKDADHTRHTASESTSLAQGTKSWNQLDTNTISGTTTATSQESDQ